MDPVFLTLDEVVEMHAEQIERYGGAHGLRDRAGLESALALPQATFGGEWLHPTIPVMAAAYLFTSARTTPSSTATSGLAPTRP